MRFQIPIGLLVLFACTVVSADPVVTAMRVPDGGVYPQAQADSRGRVHVIYFKGDPLRCQLREALDEPSSSAHTRKDTAMNGRRNRSVFVGTTAALVALMYFTVVLFGQSRITKELITQSVPDIPSRYVHVGGPVPTMEATKQILAELGVPRERIKMEAFGPAAGKVERTPTPEAAKEVPKGDAPAVALPTVTFSKSDKSAPLPHNKVILEVAEDNGVDIDYSCRVGICGVCRIKMTDGQVTMEVQDGLQP